MILHSCTRKQQIEDSEVKVRWNFHILMFFIYFFFFSRHYNPSGFQPAQLALRILSRKVLLSTVASGTSNPQPGEEPGI
jgi:hypothetical protein